MIDEKKMSKEAMNAFYKGLEKANNGNVKGGRKRVKRSPSKKK